VQGHFEATGIRPKFLSTAADQGIEIPAELFRPQLRLG
jgi:pilus assembly protein CpaF